MTRDEAIAKLVGPTRDNSDYGILKRLRVQAAYSLFARFIPDGEPALLALLADEAVVVPKEPTEEMIRAWILGSIWVGGEEPKQYRAMLAASPYAKEKNDG